MKHIIFIALFISLVSIISITKAFIPLDRVESFNALILGVLTALLSIRWAKDIIDKIKQSK